MRKTSYACYLHGPGVLLVDWIWNKQKITISTICFVHMHIHGPSCLISFTLKTCPNAPRPSSSEKLFVISFISSNGSFLGSSLNRLCLFSIL